LLFISNYLFNLTPLFIVKRSSNRLFFIGIYNPANGAASARRAVMWGGDVSVPELAAAFGTHKSWYYEDSYMQEEF